jgi:hypothetical protein
MSRKEVYAVVVTAVVILLALWRIGASVYEYELSVLDRDAPKLEMPYYVPPAPPAKQSTPPSDEQPPTGCYTQDCLARQVIRI